MHVIVVWYINDLGREQRVSLFKDQQGFSAFMTRDEVVDYAKRWTNREVTCIIAYDRNNDIVFHMPEGK